MIEAIAFDGDDTLWHNESIYSMTQERFELLLADHASADALRSRLDAVERHNLSLFGYGIKGFTLSMIETAIEVSNGNVSANKIQRIVQFGKDMLDHPVELLEGVLETIEQLRPDYGLMLITKGDLFDQESKIARSGLADLFRRIEIVSEKDEETYRRILGELETDPARFLMVGNSVRSDVLPVWRIGGTAVHIPYHIEWTHELSEEAPPDDGRFWTLESIGELPSLLDRIGAQ